MKPKALSLQDLQGLEPRLGRADAPLESPEQYARRVQAALPNFPASVITQWFFDHSDVIEEYAWLQYESLRFECVELSESDLRRPCLARHETVAQYRNHFLRGNTSQRMSRIAQYMREFGTWPIPPIVLDNPDGAIVASWGLKYSTPYELLEGHHRLAVLYALHLEAAGPHQVWLVRRGGVRC
ncbi:hypothetical protein [Variovorax sp. UC122_21]|uniref:hypothetical protein n=1 Tax=Variovorax sp. UC122_21 TaxID=3374554 RepID=UPI003756B508